MMRPQTVRLISLLNRICTCTIDNWLSNRYFCMGGNFKTNGRSITMKSIIITHADRDDLAAAAV